MGYTNYFIPARKFFTEGFLATVKKIIEASGVSIVNGLGEPKTLPVVGERGIILNGDGEEGCETFVLRVGGGREFCKTNRRPYDLVVKAILLVAEKEGHVIEWSFDGDKTDEEYTAAVGFLESIGCNL